MSTSRDHSALVPAPGRIPDGGFRQLGLINWLLNKVLSRAAGVPRIHLVTILGQHRRLFWMWYLFGAVLWSGKLPKKDTELVILRVAHLRRCEYELQQHRLLAARRGLGPAQQQQIFDWPNADGLSPRQQALLSATDEFVEKRTITDPTWTVLADYLDHRHLIEFCLLAGQYDGLATAMSALQIPLDHPVEAAQ